MHLQNPYSCLLSQWHNMDFYKSLLYVPQASLCLGKIALTGCISPILLPCHFCISFISFLFFMSSYRHSPFENIWLSERHAVSHLFKTLQFEDQVGVFLVFLSIKTSHTKPRIPQFFKTSSPCLSLCALTSFQLHLFWKVNFFSSFFLMFKRSNLYGNLIPNSSNTHTAEL